MTLASSGQMSIGGTTANRSINVELGLSPTANSNLNQTNFRSLAGVASGTISMSNFWGKSAITISLASLTGVYGTAYPGQTAYAELIFNSNGTIQYGTSDGGMGGAGSWATPNTAGIGSSYWIRFTQTASVGGTTEYGSARGVWNQISSTLYFGVSRTANGAGYRTYTVQIASDSGGSNIVATKTGIELGAEIIF
jgi:hypothetical protein